MLGAYFSEELMEVNLAFRFVPSPLTATMIAARKSRHSNSVGGILFVASLTRC
jgi:hypothetical protein